MALNHCLTIALDVDKAVAMETVSNCCPLVKFPLAMLDKWYIVVIIFKGIQF